MVDGENPTILVVGSGSMGRRHYQNLRLAKPEHRIVVLSRPESETPDWLAARDRTTNFESVDLSALSGAVIANPAPFHHEFAIPLIDGGVPLLVEKPLADEPTRAGAIVDAASRTGVPLMVGYTLRCYQPLQDLIRLVHGGGIGRPVHVWASVGSHLESWRPGSDYRASVTAQRELGGGALLELSHEIDYCVWLLGSPVSLSASLHHSGVLDVDVEDVVDLQLEFADGATANIHLDLVDRSAHRCCRVVGTRGTAELDLLSHELTVTDAAGTDVRMYEKTAVNDMYLRQQERFLEMFARGRATRRDRALDPAANTARVVVDVVAAARTAADTGSRMVL